MIYLQI